MQIVFDPGCSSKEYAERGLVEPPRPRLCPGCRIGKPHKHGFYKRFYFDGLSHRLILVRRYFCTRCGITISFLPSFCVPKFQYSLCLLWEVLRLRLEKGCTLSECIDSLQSRFPRLRWLPQRISFYAKRFLANLPWMESILKSIFPGMKLDLDIKKRAKKC
jgi:hypothetical protein